MTELEKLIQENETLKASVQHYQNTNAELMQLVESSNKLIKNQIIEKSVYLDSVKKEVDEYRRIKDNVKDLSKIVDKIVSMREDFLDIAKEKYPKVYEEFIKDVYDSPYETLVFLNVLIKEIVR